MVYLVGFFGFVIGFFSGQMLLLSLLKDRPKKDLLENKTVRWTYGILNWVMAGIGAYSFVFLYQHYFG